MIAPPDVYRLYFHGPAYQVVGEAWAGRRRGCRAASPSTCRADQEPASAPTLLGPRLEELCFQVAGLWEAGREGRLALPAHVDRLSVLGDVSTGGGRGARRGRPADARRRRRLRLPGARSRTDGSCCGWTAITRCRCPDRCADEVRAPLRAVLA